MAQLNNDRGDIPMNANTVDALVGILFFSYFVLVGTIGMKTKDNTKQMWAALALFFGALLFGLWLEYRH